MGTIKNSWISAFAGMTAENEKPAEFKTSQVF